MLLVEKRRIYEQQLDANVVITSLEEDKSKVTDLMTEFNVVGLSYVYLVKGKKIEKDFWYWRACEENMKKATCLVMILSKAFFDEKNAARREAFWYEAGLMEARGQSVIPFICDIDRGEWDNYLNKTPIRQKQATGDIAELIAQVEQTRVFKKSFFTDRNVALYGNARTFYSQLTVLFNIKKEVLDGILARLKMLDDDEVQTRGDILDLLHKEVNFGARLYRFGKECFTGHPYYAAYLPESAVLDMDCNAVNADNKFSVLSQNFNNAACTVKVDFVIPSHEIFGVTIKPYMEININSVIRKGDLLKFLEYEAGEDVFREKLDATVCETPKTYRVYFNLYFDDDTIIVNGDGSGLGKTCNYVYAK